MPAFLLNPLFLRIGGMLLVLIGVYGVAYWKGYQSSEQEHADSDLKAYTRAFEEASAQSKMDAAAAKAASEARDAMLAKNEAMQGELKALLTERKFKDCKAGSAVLNKLNGILK